MSNVVTPVPEAFRFMYNCFKAVGVCEKHAEIVARNLLEADHRGHYSHGMNRLEMYIRDIQAKLCDPNAEPTIEKQTLSTALVNGNNGMGAVVGRFCMDLAIEKAKSSGIAIVTVHNSNHFGIAGIYTLQAIENGLIGLSFTNTSPVMVPTRAKQAAVGTNPLSMGAPAQNGDSFVLDMATTSVALGKVEVEKRKNKPIPEGWALNTDGKTETNAAKAYESMRLTPLGGTEVNSSYKGFGLAMMVEVLCGILSGSFYGPNIPIWGRCNTPSNLGHCFIAIDPNCFANGFEQRLTDLISTIRLMEPSSPDKPVLIPGDPERNHMQTVHIQGGLSYVQNQHETNAKLSAELKVPPMKSLHY